MLTTDYPTHSMLDGATLASRLWARASLRLWQRRALINVRRGRKGTPTICAGAPISHLDLTLMRNAAAFHAGLRWQQWSQAVAGTRAAQPWHVIEAQHRADPAKLSLEQARKRFDDQPRINAMRLHNAANPTAPQLDVHEVEVYQAGYQAYQHYHAMTALCGDAMMPTAGDRLQPASDSLADRINYLATATRLLDSLPGPQRIAAVTVV